MLTTSTRRKQLFLLCCALLTFILSVAQNPIVTENALPGNPASEWDIIGAGDLSIQGFATDISVNKGDTVHFKINTDAIAYTINIYRLGYYNGNGARHIGTGTITATLPQIQPSPLQDAITGLVDCGNWDESAYWEVPATAVSGVYIARLKRTDNSGASHIIFIVRDDASTSDLFFQTSDATWQAYNVYGGNSLYQGTTSFPAGHAVKVSYNRPFLTRDGAAGNWIFNAEYPMIRFLERNGYDVSYTTNIDAARHGNFILNHKVFLSVGHDEYWSAEQRSNVEAARNAGVHLAFFSGNEIYWKTRWENSTDVSNTPYRTLVCYKEGLMGEAGCGTKCDPSVEWTGLWRDGCDFSNGGACLPENALSGQISWRESSTSIKVPAQYKDFRFWRNTSITTLTPGTEAIFPDGTLGHEWNWEQYPASYPAGRMTMSETTVAGEEGYKHKLSLYRHSSGALVFGAGTIQWSWGLDDIHDRGNLPADIRMQQATVNLFADMGTQPATLQGDLVAATQSTDITAPQTTITSPVNGINIVAGTITTITGTATDADGIVAGVEISFNNGQTWQMATGTTSWSYSWTPAMAGFITIKVRGFDDSGNMEAQGTVPSANAIFVNVLLKPGFLPSEGPGGPILVVHSPANPFSIYAAEILRAEGLNEFAVNDIANVTAAVLNDYDVVILGEISITPSQATMFTDWVNAGGTLIAFKPSDELSSLLGITKIAGSLSEGYILVNTFTSAGAGIVGETIQYHGISDLYTLSGASSLATLYSNATTVTANPAVTTRTVGSNGGRAIAFTYDLARSIVYTRQGNPAWAGQERDGEAGIRADDLFYGNKPGDVQPDWVNLNKVTIPQADEQQRLLANIILQSNLHRKPLPRFWYLPNEYKAAVIYAIDDHLTASGTPDIFDKLVANSPAGCSLNDWECYRATSWFYQGISMHNNHAAAYDSLGFEMGVHVQNGCNNFSSFATLDTSYTNQLLSFQAEYTSLPQQATHRYHCIIWSDWLTQAKVALSHGIRFTLDYYYWPSSWVSGRPGMFTGSGMPMRFADIDGSMIDMYQGVTQIVEENGINYSVSVNTLLDNALGTKGYYGMFGTHDDYRDTAFSSAIIASAKARNVPVISARQALDWIDERNNSYFDTIAWSNNQLSFDIKHSGVSKLRAMLPLYSEDGELASITREGNTVAFTTKVIKGMHYAFFEALDGNYIAVYGPPTTSTISGTVVLQGRPPAPNAQWEVPLKVDLYDPGNTTTPAYTYNVMTDQYGNFSISLIPPGTYTIAVKNNRTLRRVIPNHVISAGTNTINFGILRAGDANNNNQVTLHDFSILLNTYNKTIGNPGYDPRADFNNNNFVTLSDFSLLLNNYNTQGESP